MTAITIRGIPDEVHQSLRRIAADRHTSVEALVRDSLTDLARQAQPGGIDFRKLVQDRAALGLIEDGPEWTDDLNDPALSRQVLGLPPA